MPYEVQQSPGFLGTLAGLAGAAYRVKGDLDQKAQQAKDEALQQALWQQQIGAGEAAAAKEKKIEEFQAGLKLPKNFANMKPDDQIKYLTQRAAAAQSVGDTDTATNTIALMNSISSGQYKGAETQNIYQGKIPLEKAQANRARQLHAEFEQRLEADLSKASAHDRAMIQAAGMRAQAYASRGGMSLDEQLLIKGLTEQGMLGGKTEQDAFNAAMAKWKIEAASVAKQNQVLQAEGLPTQPIPDAPTPQSVNMSLNLSGLGGDSSGLVPLLGALLKNDPNLAKRFGVGGSDASGLPPIKGQKITRGVPLGTYQGKTKSGKPYFLSADGSQYVYQDGTPVK